MMAATAPMGFDWRSRIVELVLIKQTINERDAKRLWEYRLPQVAASEERLRAVEEHLGEVLDPEYRCFLTFAGGWPAFFQAVDLFGPEDLLGGPRAVRAQEVLGYLKDEQVPDEEFSPEELLPIAVSSAEIDLFVITKQSSRRPGQVIWYAGYEVDRFTSFSEFFLAMIEYNKRELDLVARESSR